MKDDEYAKILERNNFNYIEHEDICTKAIEKYIHGKGTESEKQQKSSG
ncbi:MAG TPA: hypothetical protein GX011_02795 [Clostridiales bacterium]|jgi:predicted nucleic-acid-binding protein|nr:hypothetical protein [Clostridiales bacterium]